MSRREKLLAKIRNNPKAVRFEELTSLLDWYGFEQRRSRGSHYSYRRGHHNLIVARHKPYVHSQTVKEALRILDELSEDGE